MSGADDFRTMTLFFSSGETAEIVGRQHGAAEGGRFVVEVDRILSGILAVAVSEAAVGQE